MRSPTTASTPQRRIVTSKHRLRLDDQSPDSLSSHHAKASHQRCCSLKRATHQGDTRARILPQAPPSYAVSTHIRAHRNSAQHQPAPRQVEAVSDPEDSVSESDEEVNKPIWHRTRGRHTRMVMPHFPKPVLIDFPTYEGSPQEDPGRFLNEFEMAARASFLHEDLWLPTLGAQSLRLGAKSWLMGMAGPSFKTFCEHTFWSEFVEIFKNKYMIEAPNEVARNKRADLAHEHSVEDFVLEWRKLDAQLVAYSDDQDHKHMFMRKLKPEVRNFVMAGNPPSLSAAQRQTSQRHPNVVHPRSAKSMPSPARRIPTLRPSSNSCRINSRS